MSIANQVTLSAIAESMWKILVSGIRFTNQPYSNQFQINSTSKTAVVQGEASGWEEYTVGVVPKWKYKDKSTGKYLTNCWIKYNNNYYYMGADEFRVTGWKKIDNK